MRPYRVRSKVEGKVEVAARHAAGRQGRGRENGRRECGKSACTCTCTCTCDMCICNLRNTAIHGIILWGLKREHGLSNLSHGPLIMFMSVYTYSVLSCTTT